MRNISLYILALLLLVACAENDQQKQKSASNLNQKEEKNDSFTDSVEIITLPTPLQVPTLLKNTEGKYNAAVLLPIKQTKYTSFKSAIVFGSYLTDMSYSALFSDHQKSLQYLEQCIELGKELGLNSTVNESQIKRFRQNITKPDTLAKVILDIYDKGHEVLVNQEKEGIGLLMIMGCYMEGMQLSIHQIKDQDHLLFLHVLRMQKDYGNNLLRMLDQFEIPRDVVGEFNLFKDVVSQLNKNEIPYAFELKGEKNPNQNVDLESIKKITIAIERYRAGF